MAINKQKFLNLIYPDRLRQLYLIPSKVLRILQDNMKFLINICKKILIKNKQNKLQPCQQKEYFSIGINLLMEINLIYLLQSLILIFKETKKELKIRICKLQRGKILCLSLHQFLISLEVFFNRKIIWLVVVI
jgi:hypothetical protein